MDEEKDGFGELLHYSVKQTSLRIIANYSTLPCDYAVGVAVK